MRAGLLRHKLEVQRATETQTSSLGNPTRTWNTIATVWGSIGPLNGKEQERVREISAEINIKARIRWSSEVATITPKDRIKFGSRILEIVWLSNMDERNILIDLFCVEHV